MIGFLGINRIVVPRNVALEGHRFLRLMGQQHSEGIVLWAGVPQSGTFRVTDLLIPRQQAVSADNGLCAVIEGDEIRRINIELYRAQRQLIAQIHSHPSCAYHSAVDDEYAIVTTKGGLSLVVPDFASRPFDLNDCATYRLTSHCEWTEMQAEALAELVQVVDN